MSEIKSDSDLIQICKIQADTSRLSEVLTQNDKIIIYKMINGSIVAFMSKDNKSTLDSKIDLFSEFWYEFCCLESLYDEQKVHTSKFIEDFEKLKEFYEDFEKRIDSDIEHYKRVLEDSERKMEEFRKLEETEVGRREVEKKMTNRLMNLKDKTGYLGELQETKEKIKVFAEKKAEVEKNLNCSQGVLECLHYLKNVLINDDMNRIDKTFNHFLEEMDRVNRYITNIKQEDFKVLTDANRFNIQEVKDYNEFMCEKVKTFKEINLDFMFIYFSTFVNHECIQFIHDQWNMYVQVAGFIAAFPYFKAEIDYFLGKKNKAEFRFDANFSRDHLKRVQECMEKLQFNCETLGTEIEKVIILGEVEWSSSEIVGYSETRDSNGNVTRNTIRKPYINSFSSNLYLRNDVEKKVELRPEEVQESNRTLETRVFKDKCNRDYAQVYENFMLYKKIYDEYENLKKKVIDHKNSIGAHHNALNEELEKLCSRFRLFREIFTKKILRIDESFNCSLFSLFLTNCNIQTCPGICSSGISSPLITNHLTPDYLFSCFVKAFKTNQKKLHTPCCQAENITYLSFDGIDLDDIRLVLFDYRVLGSLKNNNGKVQEVRGRIREEEFDRAMFNILSQSIKCVAIHSQKRYNIDSNNALKLIEKWQQAGEKIIQENKYKKLLIPYQKKKFTTDTRVK